MRSFCEFVLLRTWQSDLACCGGTAMSETDVSSLLRRAAAAAVSSSTTAVSIYAVTWNLYGKVHSVAFDSISHVLAPACGLVSVDSRWGV